MKGAFFIAMLLLDSLETHIIFHPSETKQKLLTSTDKNR